MCGGHIPMKTCACILPITGHNDRILNSSTMDKHIFNLIFKTIKVSNLCSYDEPLLES